MQKSLELVTFILGIVLFSSAQNPSKKEPPVVKIVSLDYSLNRTTKIPWRNVSSLLDKDNVFELNTNFTNIRIDCKSLYPIKWTFEGVTAPLQLNLTTLRKFIGKEEFFIAEFVIVRVTSQLTGKWSCQLLENSSIRTSISIFGQDYGYRGEDPFFLEFGKNLTIYAKRGEEVTFPCISWKRNITAYLAKKVKGDVGMIFRKVDPLLISFSPSIGFKMTILENDANPWGHYICYTVLNKTFDTVKILLRERFDVTVSPEMRELEFFENEVMKLECNTNDPFLRVELFTSNDPRIEYMKNRTGIQLFYHNLTLSDDGTFVCNVFNLKDREPVFTRSWSYSVISKADRNRRGWKYYFSRRTQKPNWACWTKSSNVPSVAFVRCTSPMECDVRSSCFKLANRCDEMDAKTCAGGCVSISVVKTPGIMTCNGDGIQDRRLQLYIGASNKTHNSTELLFNDKLKAFSSVGNETYEKSIIDVNCTGSSFYFSKGFYWSVCTFNQSENESSCLNRLDNENRVLENVATVIDYKEKFDKTGLVILKSRIQLLSKNIGKIVCNAPHWDSLNKTEYSLSLTIKETSAPSFSESEEEDYVSLSDRQYDKIRCDVKGIPQPSITWLKDNQELPKTIEVINEGDTLLFDEITFAHQGSYTCNATNPGGSVQKRFALYISDPKQKVIWGISITGVIAMIILLGFLILFWRRIQRQKEMLRNLTDAEIEEFLYGNPDAIDRSGETNRQGHLLAYNRDYEFPKDALDIQMEEKLGSGAYGLVIRGIARGLFPGQGQEETVVAIKTLQPNADISYFKALLIELKIMSVIGRNPYIVNLLGACTTDIRKREVFIIVEYCANGSLEKFLKSHRGDFTTFQSNVRYSVEPRRATVLYENQVDVHPQRITYDNLLVWCYEIAKGMEYLASKKVIHGDMAARNVLITDRLFAKIGDFGLSRQLYEYANYVKKQQAPLPWRWMAIESLCDMEFSCASDVWSYGVTVWEIFSLGEIPYPGTSWTEDFVKKLRQGNRPPKPDLAHPSVYNVMVECWRYEAGDRPSFTELAKIFMSYLHEQGIPYEEPLPPPTRRKFDLQINNEAYRVDTEEIGKQLP